MHLTPRHGQLIAAALAATVACLPIYAMLSVVAFGVTSAVDGTHPPTILGFVGALLVAIPFSLFGIVIWPISVLVAVTLFALAGRLLFTRYLEHSARRWIWAGAGAVVGLLTGIAMSLEAAWKSSDLFPEVPSFGGLAFAIPTGILGGLICRRIIRHLMRGPGRYAPNRF